MRMPHSHQQYPNRFISFLSCDPKIGVSDTSVFRILMECIWTLFSPLNQRKNIRVITSRNRNLNNLKNIGKKIASRLNIFGIFSEDDLRLVGAVGSHRLIKERYPNETLPVCYYLYSFEGALTDKHWNEIGEHAKVWDTQRFENLSC